jgi:hypothetical protein
VRDLCGAVLTCIFWALFFLPGYALLRRYATTFLQAGALFTLALSYATSLLLISPLSLLCYAIGAPLWLFSVGLALLCSGALVVLVRTRADRDLVRIVRAEPVLPYLLLLGLLWLQARVGGWLDGDATFHLGRMRVLLEHGFTNRDIYLAQFHFQHVYHSNLLFPLYASLAQLTGQSYLDAWFHSEAWAKLMVGCGHYVLGYLVTRRRLAGFLLALCIITVNAGETYALYPNTLCVGFLLPMLLGFGFDMLAPLRNRSTLLLMAALDFVLAQIHALYAVYAALLLVPLLSLAWFWPRARGERLLLLMALCSLTAAAPFVLVSSLMHLDGAPLTAAPDPGDSPIPVAPATGLASDPPAHVLVAPALAAGGGHLEKVMESIDDEHIVFTPERMGGRLFVLIGFIALCLACLSLPEQRAQLVGVLLSAAGLSALLFSVRGATAAMRLLQTPFVVARLSTVLTSLLFLGIVACLARSSELWPRAQRVLAMLLMLLSVGVSTQLLGHAPISFADHVRAALRPFAERHALLEELKQRRVLLQSTVPPGTTVLTTARFARQVVMLCDCYVLAADRGHTHVAGIAERRRDLVYLNAPTTTWERRQALLAHYGLHIMVFERRWQRRFHFAYEHGELLGSAAGLDVVHLP